LNKLKVLIVDDEWNMRNLIRIYLNKNGIDVKECSNGSEAMMTLQNETFDLVILDVMMPGMDGWDVVTAIREFNTVPILMLTARTDTKDKVKGLQLGADDYLAKPFEPEELIARVLALIRRNTLVQQSESEFLDQLCYEDLVISREAREVKVKANQVEFTQKEFDLLCILAEHPRRAYTREMLLDSVWGPDYFGDMRTVDTHIKNIRDKTQRAGLPYNPIQTVWGVGYKFNDRR
jgi:two-component system, OmpR family, response regulator ResD